MKRRFGLGLAAITSVAGAALGMATPAAAVTPDAVSITGNGSTSTCSAYSLCLYQDQNYRGKGMAVPGVWGFNDINFGIFVPINDATSSIINRSSQPYCFYSERGFGGLTFQIHGQENWPSINTYINDKISSFRPGNC